MHRIHWAAIKMATRMAKMTQSELIEQLAEVIARGRSEGGRRLFNGWNSLDQYDKDMWRFAASAALAFMRSQRQFEIEETYDAAMLREHGMPWNMP